MFLLPITATSITYNSHVANGQGINAETCTSLKECIPLANSGKLDAQLFLAVHYELKLAKASHTQEGSEKEIATYKMELLKWLTLAAEQGFSGAQANLGNLYYRGQYIDKDFEKALYWRHKAAEQGYLIAQASLGAMYHRGKGVPTDNVQAYAWLNNAVKYGKTSADRLLEKVTKTLSPEELAAAEQLSEEYYKKYVEPYRPPPKTQKQD